MSGLSLKDHVKGDVLFSRYHRGNLWYITEMGFEFPVPIEDTGDAEFKGMDKGLFFMRWIRKHLEVVQAARIEQNVN